VQLIAKISCSAKYFNSPAVSVDFESLAPNRTNPRRMVSFSRFFCIASSSGASAAIVYFINAPSCNS
jgi:hypothetical protein